LGALPQRLSATATGDLPGVPEQSFRSALSIPHFTLSRSPLARGHFVAPYRAEPAVAYDTKYTKQSWSDLPSTSTPITKARLEHIEDGLEAVSIQVVALSTGNAPIVTNPGTGGGTTPTVDTTKPTAPVGASAVANGPTQITVNRGTSTDLSGIVSYRIRRDGSDLPGATAITAPTFVDTTVQASKTYRYTVSSVDGAGLRSDEANIPLVTTPAAGTVVAPAVTISSVTTTLDATSGTYKATVTWAATAGNNGVTLVDVTACRDNLDSSGAGAYCSPTDPLSGNRVFDKLLPGRVYNFTVQARTAGAVAYGPVQVVTSTMPSTTANITFQDTFPEADGAALNPAKWVIGVKPAIGGGATVQGHMARLATGTQGGYNPNDKITLRTNRSNVADVDLTFPFRYTGEATPNHVWIRSTKPNDDAYAGQAYAVSLVGNPTLKVFRDYTETALSSATSTVLEGSTYMLRFRAMGSLIQAKFWPQGQTETANWNIGSVTNTAVTAAGATGFTISAGGDAASRYFYFGPFTDTVPVADGSGPTTPNTGTTTPPVTTDPPPLSSGGRAARMAAITMPSRGFFSGASGNDIDNANWAFGDIRGDKTDFLATWLDDPDAKGWGWGILDDGSGPASGQLGMVDLAMGGPRYDDSWQTWADGAYDQRFRDAMVRLRRNRTINGALRPTCIRIGHEPNIDQYPWKVWNGREDAYCATLRRFRGIADQVYPELLMSVGFNGDTTNDCQVVKIMNTVKDFIDLMGVDLYNQYPFVGTKNGVFRSWSSFLNETHNGPRGPEAWRQLALASGVPMYFPEHANNGDANGEGGDDPHWINNFYPWMKANAGKGAGKVFAEGWFNMWDQFAITGPEARQPNVLAAYKDLFPLA
jgi:hypothetical protein